MSFLSFIERFPKEQIGEHLPPFLQPINVNDFLDEHDAVIKRLKLAYSDTESWDSKILPCIEQLALLCGHLPYSANGVFSDVDSLFKASIQAATYAVEIMESTVQLEKNIMAQHLLQGRLKAASLLAGLCAFLDTLEKISISEHSINKESSFFHISEHNHVNHLAFNPLAMPYDVWVKEKLKNNPSVVLTLHWKNAAPITQSRQNLRLFYARHILVSETMAWLGEAGSLPLIELMKCLTVDSDLEEAPSSVIKARDLGVYRACQLEREHMGAKLGKVLAPQGWQTTLIRILRARILNDWEINAKDSPLRKGADGLFLFWPDICPIILDDLKNFGLTDLPTDPDIWAGCLLESGITIPSKKGLSSCWIAVTPNAKPREAIKLSDAHFFTGNKSLYAKTIKRNFETELSQEQSTALSQLTRNALESTDKVFTQHIPSEHIVAEQQTIIWYICEKYEDSNPSPAAMQKAIETFGSAEAAQNALFHSASARRYFAQQLHQSMDQSDWNNNTPQPLSTVGIDTMARPHRESFETEKFNQFDQTRQANHLDYQISKQSSIGDKEIADLPRTSAVTNSVNNFRESMKADKTQLQDSLLTERGTTLSAKAVYEEKQSGVPTVFTNAYLGGALYSSPHEYKDQLNEKANSESFRKAMQEIGEQDKAELSEVERSAQK